MSRPPITPPGSALAPKAGRHSAATKIGCTHAEYDERRAAGERWCNGCRLWHPTAAFSHRGTLCRRGDWPSRASATLVDPDGSRTPMRVVWAGVPPLPADMTARRAGR